MGFDRLNRTLRKVVARMDEGTLDEKWMAVSCYLERFSAEKVTHNLCEWGNAIISAAGGDGPLNGYTEDHKPQDRLISTCCVVLDRLVDWLVECQPEIGALAQRIREYLYQGLFVEPPDLEANQRLQAFVGMSTEKSALLSAAYEELQAYYEENQRVSSILAAVQGEMGLFQAQLNSAAESGTFWKAADRRLLFTSWRQDNKLTKEVEAVTLACNAKVAEMQVPPCSLGG
jgi:hypothetical protein